MKEGPDISKVAALIGDPARSNMLLSLMDGRALTASELANCAGITKQTASTHLARLLNGGLLEREVQGRHHYYRLFDSQVADTIETLLSLAEQKKGMRTRVGPSDPALRKARICYDHLAGELGILLFDQMSDNGWLTYKSGELRLSDLGWHGLGQINLDPSDLGKTRRPQCRTCLDWSMRRHHLAGQTGAMILDRILKLRWAERLSESRAIKFSLTGERAFRNWLD